MLQWLTDLLIKIQGVPEEQPLPRRVPADGVITITELSQISEPYCDISSKEYGERYLGLETEIVYLMSPSWEFDD